MNHTMEKNNEDFRTNMIEIINKNFKNCSTDDITLVLSFVVGITKRNSKISKKRGE